jgi:hypothetical protein
MVQGSSFRVGGDDTLSIQTVFALGDEWELDSETLIRHVVCDFTSIVNPAKLLLRGEPCKNFIAIDRRA